MSTSKSMNPDLTTMQTLTGVLLDDSALSLDELARACRVEPDWVVRHVAAGVLGDEASVQALKTLLEILGRNEGVGIYPEGTRSRDGILYRGRTGVGWLALTTGAPVVPVGMIGTEKLQPAGAKGFRPAKFTLRFGKPLYFEKTGPDHSLPARRHVTDTIMDAIAELTGQERSPKYNQSPNIE